MQKPPDLKLRTKDFALRVMRLVAALDNSRNADVIGRQVLRCGMSVGAQYREACRARSDAEFISKLESALQELDETSYWLEILAESGLLPAKRLLALIKETNELIRIFVRSILTVKKRKTSKEMRPRIDA